MRVYLPATLGRLRQLIDVGHLPAPTPGFAVTPALREWYAEGDLEDLEYVALCAAARSSLRLLAAEGAPWRRVVLAAEVADADVAWAPAQGRAAVVVTVQVRRAQVAAAHVDDPSEAEVIAAAARALPVTDRTDGDAGSDAGLHSGSDAWSGAVSAVEAADDVELQWWATQELEQVVAAAVASPPE